MSWKQVGRTEFSDENKVKTRSPEEMLRAATGSPLTAQSKLSQAISGLKGKIAGVKPSLKYTVKKPGFDVKMSDVTTGKATAQAPAKASKMRSVLLAMGVPVKNMTAEEKKRFQAQTARVSEAAKLRKIAEQARLARIAQISTGLSPVGSYVGGGQFGSFGTGIAPKGL